MRKLTHTAHHALCRWFYGWHAALPYTHLCAEHKLNMPSLVSTGDWGIGDDRRLLKALYRAGHAREWQVDWGAAVPERSAVAAKRRWRLMLKSVPAYQEKEFTDIVEELVSAHLPALMDKAARGQAAGTSAADGQAASG